MSRAANGEGSIYQRKDGRWVGAVYVLTVVGGFKRVSAYGRTRKEVHEKLTELKKRSQDGVPAETSLQVGQYLFRWLEDVARPQVRARTFETYSRCVRLHLAPVLGTKQLKALSPAHVRQFMNTKIAEGLSPRTVRYLHAVLRSALSQALRDGLVQRNVAMLVRSPREDTSWEAKALSAAEVRMLLDAAREDRLWALWVIAVTLGLRRGELLGLCWSAVDIDRGILRVRQSVQRVGGRLTIDEVKSARSRRTLPLPRVALEALREHRKRQLEERRGAGSLWQDHDLVFCTMVGAPIDPRNLHRSFRALLIRSRVGVRTEVDTAGRTKLIMLVRMHDLRHTCASYLLAQGVPARVVMEILGHSGIGITMDTYSHVLPTLLEDSVRRMDELFHEDE